MRKPQEERHRYWRQLIAQQEQSGQSVRTFCQQHGTSEASFYQWRKRLAEQLPMRFALVETTRSAPAAAVGVELMLTTGERLRVAPGADASTLRLVLSVLREPR